MEEHLPSFQYPNLIDSIGYSTSSHASDIITENQITHGYQSDPELPLPPDISDATMTMYLGMKARLPVRSIQEELLIIFFQECNWFFGLLEPYCFRKLQRKIEAIEQDVSRNAQQMLTSWSFTALLFQTLAVALQFLPAGATCIEALAIQNRATRDALSERYSNISSHIISIVSQTKTDITCVECLLLRAFWLKNSGRGKESWRALGNCVRYRVQVLRVQSV